jgi:hypothetical protein
LTDATSTLSTMLRRTVRRVMESTDPVSELGSRWRPSIRRIRDALERIRALGDEGLDDVGARLWATAWDVAVAAGSHDEALPGVDPGRVALDLEASRQRLAQVPEGSVDAVSAAAEVNAREIQFRAVHESWNLVDDVDEGLRDAAGGVEEAATFALGLPGLREPDRPAAAAQLGELTTRLLALRASLADASKPTVS